MRFLLRILEALDRTLTRPLDIGNRAEINRRLRIIQGLDANPCRALMVVPKSGTPGD